jgi:hypothetical protein
MRLFFFFLPLSLLLAASHTLTFHQGWNMMVIPLHYDANMSVEHFKTTVLKTNHLQQIKESTSDTNATTIQPTHTYYAYSDANFSVDLNGTILPRDINLSQDTWSVVHGYDLNLSVNTLLATFDGIEMIRLKNGSGIWETYHRDEVLNTLETNTTLKTGEFCFIKSTTTASKRLHFPTEITLDNWLGDGSVNEVKLFVERSIENENNITNEIKPIQLVSFVGNNAIMFIDVPGQYQHSNRIDLMLDETLYSFDLSNVNEGETINFER